MSMKREVYQQKIKYLPHSSYITRKNKSNYSQSVGLRRWLVEKKKLIAQTYRVEKVFTL